MGGYLLALHSLQPIEGKLPAFTAAELDTPEKYLDKLLEERGHEFYMEGVRRKDLIRHGRFVEMAIKKNEYAGQSTENVKRMENGKYVYELLPIPPSIIRDG